MMKRILCLLLIGLLWVGGFWGMSAAHSESPLPVVGSADHLKQLLQGYQGRANILGMGLGEAVQVAALGTPSHSGTNVQVPGIDEADVVKTDGNYLYHIAGGKVLVTQAWPASSLNIVRELEFEGFIPNSLYVDGNYLVVMGLQQEEPAPEAPLEHFLMAGYTRVLVFDIRDKEKIKLHKDLALDGFIVTSRKDGNFLYLVNTRMVSWLENEQEPAQPWYRDSSGEKKLVGYEDIRYFPEGSPCEYVLCAAVDLSSGKMNVQTYLGWIQGIHMSKDSLYLAMASETKTTIHKFSIGFKLKYQGKGEVPGNPLNQFSIDEHKGYIRIATSLCQEQGPSVNNVYILNSKMKVAGKIEGIAPGETIFAARFLGSKAYLVTYEMVDPLLVLDLKNPKAPKISGEAKLPGFSTYLQPLDGKHLLGIGQHTETRPMDERDYVITNGVKLAVYDVSDATKPKEEHGYVIGKSGTWSEALYDHRAVFLRDGVLAINIGIVEGESESSLAYHGALFFNIDPEKGFTELGRISHESDTEPEWFEHPFSIIKRVVQIGDFYYTISDSWVMVHNKSFVKLSELKLPDIPRPDFWPYN